MMNWASSMACTGCGLETSVMGNGYLVVLVNLMSLQYVELLVEKYNYSHEMYCKMILVSMYLAEVG